MNPIVYHIVSGHAWFSGIGLLLLAVVLDRRSAVAASNRGLRKFGNLLWLAAVLLMALSSVAAPVPIYAWLFISLVAWLWGSSRSAVVESASGQPNHEGPAAEWEKDLKTVDRSHQWAGGMLVLSLLAAIAVELPYHFQPTLLPVSEAKITIVGDSVTAGVGGNETSERWPEILQRVHGLQVQDISHMGETANSATKTLLNFQVDSPIIIVEIGGNDVLGGTSVSEFDRDLDQLLKSVCKGERQVVMFELPLPPFFHGYGYVQRRLAQEHGVKLLPKATFLSAIAGADSTLDSIHLSQAGHKRMADAIWGAVGEAFAPTR